MAVECKKENLISKVLFNKVEDLRLKLKIAYAYVKPYIPEEAKGQAGAMAFTLKSMYDTLVFSKKNWKHCIEYLRYGKMFLKFLKKYGRGAV